MTKWVNENSNDFLTVYKNAHIYDYFEIDASELANDAVIGFSGNEVEKPHMKVCLAGWQAKKSVMIYHHKIVKTVDHTPHDWTIIRSKIKVIVVDGNFEITANGSPYLSYQDSSIKKSHFRYLKVTSSWKAHGVWTIQATGHKRKVHIITRFTCFLVLVTQKLTTTTTTTSTRG